MMYLLYGIVSFLFSLLLGRQLVSAFKIENCNQPIRGFGPELHLKKTGTPTMGAAMIFLICIPLILLFCDWNNFNIWVCIFIISSFALLGLYDDLKKISNNSYLGLSSKNKFVMQLVTAFIAAMGLYCYYSRIQGHVYIPGFNGLYIDMGYFYPFFAAVVINASSNSVNLTDGLDGLAIVPITIILLAFAVIFHHQGRG